MAAVAAAADAEEAAVVVVAKPKHTVGIGWRPQIASFILENSDLIHDLEILVENFYKLSNKDIKTLRFLDTLFDLHFHSVGLGICGSEGIPKRELKKYKKFFSLFSIESWSDHFSFVRSGGIELGHLAAPSWNDETINITLKNLKHAKNELGHIPALENISTLLYPPLSTYSETDWMKSILLSGGQSMLLDINNIYCNAMNFKLDPFQELDRYPFDHVTQIHMSGGKWIQFESDLHMLDDHKQDIPEIGFQMLKFALSKLTHPVSIIIERDGNYPASAILKQQLIRIHQLINEKDAPIELFSI